MNKLLALPIMNTESNKLHPPKEIVFKIMCSKGHYIGTQQEEKKVRRASVWVGAGKGFQGKVGFVLKVCEEELTKWTKGRQDKAF